jgi:CRISPR-associated endonuclease/helicase Cas3
MEERRIRCFLDDTPVPKSSDKYDREQLSQNSIGVPSTWEVILPSPKYGLHYLLMMKTEDGWRFDYEGGYLLYTQGRGLQRVKT